MSVVKDVDLEAMPTSIFINDDDDDENHSISQLTVYYILAVQFRTHSVGETVNF